MNFPLSGGFLNQGMFLERKKIAAFCSENAKLNVKKNIVKGQLDNRFIIVFQERAYRAKLL